MKSAIINARVFNGHSLDQPATVVIDDTLIGTDPVGAEVIDARGAILLPGLIDTHVHLNGIDTLKQLASYGVTTALDMGLWPATLLHSLRGVTGVTDFRSAGTPAAAPGGVHAHMPGFPPDGIVENPAQAESFIRARVAEGADYIKVIVESSGPGALDQPTLNAIVDAAHAHGRRVVAHAVTSPAFAMAIEAGVDVVTHAPLDHALSEAVATRMAAEGRVSVPTLTMMEGLVEQSGRPGLDYAASRASVIAFRKAGVLILAGTDANAASGVPARIPHGQSLHHELGLLVDAGLSPVDALRAATILPATHFGMPDRGAITPGLRADLILVDGDPTRDIRATRNLQRIWCAGTECQPA